MGQTRVSCGPWRMGQMRVSCVLGGRARAYIKYGYETIKKVGNKTANIYPSTSAPLNG